MSERGILKKKMTALLVRFVREERGQDLTEYTLLMAFIMLIIIGLAIGTRDSVLGITTVSNNDLARANQAVASGNPVF